MTYKIVDENNNDEVLFQSDDKFETENALLYFLNHGHDAYILEICYLKEEYDLLNSCGVFTCEDLDNA